MGANAIACFIIFLMFAFAYVWALDHVVIGYPAQIAAKTMTER